MASGGYSSWSVMVGRATLDDCPRCGNLLATRSTHVFGFGLDVQGAFERLHCGRCRTWFDTPTDCRGIVFQGVLPPEVE